jgi:hypothetical protein
MGNSISELVNRWDLAGFTAMNGDHYNQLHQKIVFLQKHLYDQYVPAKGPEHLDYQTRLEQWLENTTDDSDKRLLFELAPNLTFFTREDFIKLYQAALRGPIARWLIDILNVTLDSPDLDNKLQEQIHEHTWYCPITDSMQISEFHHANNIGGIDHRPDWRSLAQFGDPAKIIQFMQSHEVGGVSKPLRQIVLLEDFIGSGTQMRIPDVAQFIASFPATYRVLFVPLIICPEGAKYARDLVAKYNWFTFAPLMEIAADHCITCTSPPAAGTFEKAIYNLAIKTYPQVKGNNGAGMRPYGPFGFHDTGAQIVMYSNTPANTLPLIQHRSNTWNPLFGRSARIK